MTQDGKAIASFSLKENNLYSLDNVEILKEYEANYFKTKQAVAPEIWHARLGHPADGKMEKIGIIQADKDCDACSVAKMKSLPHQRSTGPGKYKPGDLVAGDYKLVKNANLENEDVGFFILIDRSSGFHVVFPVHGKDDHQTILSENAQYLWSKN